MNYFKLSCLFRQKTRKQRLIESGYCIKKPKDYSPNKYSFNKKHWYDTYGTYTKYGKKLIYYNGELLYE